MNPDECSNYLTCFICINLCTLVTVTHVHAVPDWNFGRIENLHEKQSSYSTKLLEVGSIHPEVSQANSKKQLLNFVEISLFLIHD